MITEAGSVIKMSRSL